MLVVIIEDDSVVLDMVTIAFESSWPGTRVLGASSGAKGLDLVKDKVPDLVIVDVALPEGDRHGFDLCKRIRMTTDTPVIMLTGRDWEFDIVRGLELGAADYITKPFSALELLARARAVLRRARMEMLDVQQQPPYIGKRLSVDFQSRTVLVNGSRVHLTVTEFNLLSYFMKHPRQRLSQQAILEGVWGDESPTCPSVVRAHVQRLRHKLEDRPPSTLIVTDRGWGYCFCPEDS